MTKLLCKGILCLDHTCTTHGRMLLVSADSGLAGLCHAADVLLQSALTLCCNWRLADLPCALPSMSF